MHVRMHNSSYMTLTYALVPSIQYFYYNCKIFLLGNRNILLTILKKIILYLFICFNQVSHFEKFENAISKLSMADLPLQIKQAMLSPIQFMSGRPNMYAYLDDENCSKSDCVVS